MIDAGKGEAWVIQTRVAARCAVAGGASRGLNIGLRAPFI